MDKNAAFYAQTLHGPRQRHKPTAGGFVCNRIPQVSVSLSKITTFPTSQKNFHTTPSLPSPDPQFPTQTPHFNPTKSIIYQKHITTSTTQTTTRTSIQTIKFTHFQGTNHPEQPVSFPSISCRFLFLFCRSIVTNLSISCRFGVTVCRFPVPFVDVVCFPSISCRKPCFF